MPNYKRFYHNEPDPDNPTRKRGIWVEDEEKRIEVKWYVSENDYRVKNPKTGKFEKETWFKEGQHEG